MEHFVWKCKCGFIEHGEMPSGDCPECLRVNSFKKVPEEQLEEAVEEEILSANGDEDEN